MVSKTDGALIEDTTHGKFLTVGFWQMAEVLVAVLVALRSGATASGPMITDHVKAPPARSQQLYQSLKRGLSPGLCTCRSQPTSPAIALFYQKPL